MFPCTLPCRTVSQLKWLLVLLACTCTLFHAARSQQDLEQMVTCYNSNGCASQGSFQVTLRECCLDHDPNAHPRTYRDDPAAEICISCLVIGFEKSEYTLNERNLPYRLPVRVLSNRLSIKNYVTLSVRVGSGNATSSDYRLTEEVIMLHPFRLQATQEISILKDQTVLEGVQTVTLEIERVGGQLVPIFRPTTITINDTDEFTAVACYDGTKCGAEPVQVDSIQTCCKDLSALKSYRTVGDVNTCNPCLVVGFENNNYQLQERSDSYEVSVKVLTPPASLQRPINVSVHTVSGTALDGSDYSLGSSLLTLSPSSPLANQTINIPQDGIVLEDNETFALTLSHAGGQPAVELRNATVVIVDTDDFTGVACYNGRTCGNTPDHLSTVADCCLQNISALRSYRTPENTDTCTICLVVGFGESQYTLEENVSPYQLTVNVLSPPDSIVADVRLTVSATDGSAIRDSDYSLVTTGPSSIVTLSSTNQQTTTAVIIIRDGIVLEEEETFSLQLQQRGGQPVIGFHNTTVSIVDTDVLTSVACYTGDVCGTTPQQVSSVSDCCLDNLSVLRSYKTVSDQETCVTCLVIGYERSHYMLAEQQDMYELTIKILTPPGSLKNSVSLEVTGQSGNATGGTDYSLSMGNYTHVTLSPSAPAVNHTLRIQNDGVVLEETEAFSLQLQQLSGQVVNDLRGTDVVIVDTDVLQGVACYETAQCAGASPPIVNTVEECCLQNISSLRSYRTASNVDMCHPCLVIGFMQSHYRLREQISPYQLTIQVLSPPQSLVEDTGLVITATDGTAIRGSDYSVVTGPLSLITPTNQQTTTAVTIIRDGIVLEEEETFSLQLQQTSGQQPVVAVQNTTVTIVDGDVLTGVACYEGGVCGTTPEHLQTVGDCCLQNISVLKSYRQSDDDSLCTSCLVIGFERTHYALTEQNSPHQIFVEVLSDPSSLQTNVTLQVTAQSGNSTNGIDFSLTVSEVTLTPTTPRVSIPLDIIDDGVVLEGTEVFRLQLQRSGGQAIVDIRNAVISIIDTDVLQAVACYDGAVCNGYSPPVVASVEECCRDISALKSYKTASSVDICHPCLAIGFNQTSYRLDEQTEPYELTIQVLTPPQSLVGDIGVIITATDGSAIRGDDYSLVTGPSSIVTLSSTNQQTTTVVSIIRDGIVLEEEETFSLQLQQTSGQQPVVAIQNTTVTIVDGDVLTGVACYDGAVCGSTPVHLPSLHACCLTDTSVLKTYKSAGDQSQCDSCLVIGFEMNHYWLEERADPHQLTVKVYTPPGSLTSAVTLRVTAVPNNATTAIDYSLPSTTLTLTPSTPQVNQTVSILTDGIVLEGPETLSLLLQQVSGQPVTDLRSTTVTVIDKDELTGVACYVGGTCGDIPEHLSTIEDCCMRNMSALVSYKTASNPDTCWPCLVIGFTQNQYQLQENAIPYQLDVQVLTPPQSLVESVGITVTAAGGSAIRGSDYLVMTGPLSLMSLTPTNQQTTTVVSIIRDGIVLEEEETFSLQLQQTSGQQPVVAVQNTTVTIVDGDVLTGVACYDAGVCGGTPQHLATVADCCQRDVSILKSYRTAQAKDVCSICLVIGFDSQLYQLDEQAVSHQLTVSILTPPVTIRTIVTLQVTAQPGNTTGPADYSLPSSLVTLSPGNTRTNLPLNIIRDGIVLEGSETFSLQLQRTSGQLTSGLIGTTIVINDRDDLTGVACYIGGSCGNTPVHLPRASDCCSQNVSTLKTYRTAADPSTCHLCLVVGFAQEQYQLEERPTPFSLTIAVLSPPQSLVNNIGLTVTAVDGTAINGQDYLVQTGVASRTVTPHSRETTYSVTLVNDGIVLEEGETFDLQLQQTSGQPVTVFQDTTVTIIDQDVLTGVACYDSGACGNTPSHLPTTGDCCQQNITRLKSYRTAGSPDTCALCLVIGFELEQYNVDERAEAYQLTVKILTPISSLHSNVTVRVAAVPGNVTSDDFSLQSGTLSLTPTSPQATQSLTIIRDGVVLEGREVFELQLHLVSAGQPVSKLVGTKVVIQDTDAFNGVACYSERNCEGSGGVLMDSVAECCRNYSIVKTYRNSDNLEVCHVCLVVGFSQEAYLFDERVHPYNIDVQVLSPPESIVQPVRVSVDVGPGNATRGIDYSVTTGALSQIMLSPEVTSRSHSITIPLDMVAFEKKETLTLMLQQTGGPQVSLLLNTTIHITDHERSVAFRFSRLSYNGSESSGEICATVLSVGLALIDIQLNILPMTLSQYSATRQRNLPSLGSGSDPAEFEVGGQRRDFNSTQLSITFDGTEPEKQICIQVFDDEVNENNEAFVAVLQLSPIADLRLIARVIPSHTATLLTILDNDYYYLGFVEDEYVFSEATAQHIIPIRPAAGNMTEQMFIMHVIQNGTLSFGSNNDIVQRQEFRFRFPLDADSLVVDITNDQLLDSQKVITFLIMPPVMNNFGGFDKYQVSLVRIKDDEDFRATLKAPSRIKEGETLRACIVLEFPAQTNLPAKISLSNLPETAILGADYRMQTTNTSYMAVFEPGTNPRERCFEYPILRDQLAEGSETFKLYAQQVGNGADVTFVMQQVNVTIQDADEVTLGFVGGVSFVYIYSWTRSVSFTYSVLNSVQLAKPITVNFTTVDNNMRAGIDYQSVSESVTFNSSKTSHTSTVMILRTGSTGQLQIVMLTTENDYGINVKFGTNNNEITLYWV